MNGVGLESPTGHGRFNEGGFDAPGAGEEKTKWKILGFDGGFPPI